MWQIFSNFPIFSKKKKKIRTPQFTWPKNSQVNCQTRNIVYMIECTNENCKERYIRKSERTLHDRISEHVAPWIVRRVSGQPHSAQESTQMRSLHRGQRDKEISLSQFILSLFDGVGQLLPGDFAGLLMCRPRLLAAGDSCCQKVLQRFSWKYTGWWVI